MLVNQLIELLQKCPSYYQVVLNVPIEDDLPLLVDLYPEDFAIDEDRGTIEIDGAISDEADNHIQELIDSGLKLQDGEVLILTREGMPTEAITPAKQNTKSRMKALGMTVLTNEILKGI
jgi:hypothetical protein